jgi:hypothetical protein
VGWVTSLSKPFALETHQYCLFLFVGFVTSGIIGLALVSGLQVKASGILRQNYRFGLSRL